MADNQSMTTPEVVAQTLIAEHGDFLREAVAMVATELMKAEISTEIGAGRGEVSPGRTTRRNGYRPRPWETRVGEIELAIPKKRSGEAYFPNFLEPRRRSERPQHRRQAPDETPAETSEEGSSWLRRLPVDERRDMSPNSTWLTGSMHPKARVQPVRVAYIFSTSGHTASYKLGKMILPQLEQGSHGVDVVGMFFFDDNTYLLGAGDPLGERLAEVAEEQGILLMLCDRCVIERSLAEGEPGDCRPSGTVAGVRVGCFPDLYAALSGEPPDQVITL